jgi:DNA primase
MTMTAPTADEAKEAVRSATDIVQVIGERVRLRRVGTRWSGLCPFHQEKTPSFTVNPERQIWHCFGCSKGGDVFAFLMETDKVSFPAALATLAERAGIELPKAGRGPGAAVRAVERYLEDAAMGGQPTARIIHGKGRGVLREEMKRILTKNTLVKEFRLGELREGGRGVTIETLA